MNCPECGKEMTRERRSGRGGHSLSKSCTIFLCESSNCSVIGIKIYHRVGFPNEEPVLKIVLRDTIMLKERNNIAVS